MMRKCRKWQMSNKRYWQNTMGLQKRRAIAMWRMQRDGTSVWFCCITNRSKIQWLRGHLPVASHDSAMGRSVLLFGAGSAVPGDLGGPCLSIWDGWDGGDLLSSRCGPASLSWWKKGPYQQERGKALMHKHFSSPSICHVCWYSIGQNKPKIQGVDRSAPLLLGCGNSTLQWDMLSRITGESSFLFFGFFSIRQDQRKLYRKNEPWKMAGAGDCGRFPICGENPQRRESWGSETGWDLAPFAVGLAPGNMSAWATGYKETYKGLKITACMSSWGKLWTIRYKKTKNPAATSEGPGAKAGYCACPLPSTPPKGWADHLSHPSSPTPGPAPTLTPYKEPARPRT